MIYESPFRIIQTMKNICDVLDCEVCVCNDLTKLHEFSMSAKASDVLEYLEANPNTSKGEYVLMDKSCSDLTDATLFQLPTAMGKGVLVSPTGHGNIIVGPTEEDIDDKDYVDTTYKGLGTAFSQAQLSVPSLNRRFIFFKI